MKLIYAILKWHADRKARKHHWIYLNPANRTCTKCGRVQVMKRVWSPNSKESGWNDTNHISYNPKVKAPCFYTDP